MTELHVGAWLVGGMVFILLMILPALIGMVNDAKDPYGYVESDDDDNSEEHG